MTEIATPLQVRAGRLLLNWSQEELSRKAGVAVRTVRDMEGERGVEARAACAVVQALRNGGIEFVPESTGVGLRARLGEDLPHVIRRPRHMSIRDGIPLEVGFGRKRFTAFISTESLDELAEVCSDPQRTLQEYLLIFDRFRKAILGAVRIAYDRATSWGLDSPHLRVRTMDIRLLMPSVEGGKLVTENPAVMGGMPCFTTHRIPIENVLSSLRAGTTLQELKLCYPFLTQAHVEAAQEYVKGSTGTDARSAGARAPISRRPGRRRAAT